MDVHLFFVNIEAKARGEEGVLDKDGLSEGVDHLLVFLEVRRRDEGEELADDVGRRRREEDGDAAGEAGGARTERSPRRR